MTVVVVVVVAAAAAVTVVVVVAAAAAVTVVVSVVVSNHLLVFALAHFFPVVHRVFFICFSFFGDNIATDLLYHASP